MRARSRRAPLRSNASTASRSSSSPCSPPTARPAARFATPRARGAPNRPGEIELLLGELPGQLGIAEREVRECGLRAPREVARAGHLRSREACTDGQEVLEPFGEPPLLDPQPTARKAKNLGRERSALCLRVERRERLLGSEEVASLDEGLDEDSTVQNPVQGRRGERRGGERCPGIALGRAEIAAS